MSNVHRRSGSVNTRPARSRREFSRWSAWLAAGVIVLVTAGCAVSPEQSRGPVPLLLAVAVAIVVMGVRGMARIVADLLGEAGQLLVRLVRLALLIVFVAGVTVVVGALFAASLIASTG